MPKRVITRTGPGSLAYELLVMLGFDPSSVVSFDLHFTSRQPPVIFVESVVWPTTRRKEHTFPLEHREEGLGSQIVSRTRRAYQITELELAEALLRSGQ